MPRSSRRAEVRRVGRAARRKMTGAARVRAERALIEHLCSLHAVDPTRTASVGVFLAHDGEPNLRPLVERLWDAGATVALPVVADDPGDYSMVFRPWEHDDDLQSGRYGIPVPPDRPPVSPATLLVSLVGFDGAGNRMGRGAGYFDRYLATTGAEVVGVGFESQRFDVVPTEPHDVPLPAIVTDLGVRFIRTKKRTQ